MISEHQDDWKSLQAWLCGHASNGLQSKRMGASRGKLELVWPPIVGSGDELSDS